MKPLMDMSEACARLRSDEPVAFPTETVYGLGALANSPKAVQKVFAYKGRPADNPMIVHISDFHMLNQVVTPPSELAHTLMRRFWPGPLTLVLPRLPQVPDIVTAGLPTVAVRMPRHELALSLIRQVGPLVAPSANLSGSPSPTTAAHVRADFGDHLLVLDGGPCSIGLESTVIALAEDHIQLLRPGQISAEMLTEVTGFSVEIPSLKPGSTPPSPGMKYRHYAPRAGVAWLDPKTPQNTVFSSEVMVLVMSRADIRGENVVRFDGVVSMAQRLYACFREADQKSCTKVLVEGWEMESSGLSLALKNRVEKACQG